MDTMIKNNKQIPELSTEHIYISDVDDKLKDVYAAVDDIIDSLKLKKRDALHMKLLFEETIGMVKAITEDFTAKIWVEKYKDECWLRLIGKTDMNIDKKSDLMSVSSTGENALAVGFMGKVKDFIETGLLNYDGVMKLQQKYNGYGAGIGGTYLDTSVVSGPGAYGGFLWSMDGYKDSLDDNVDSQKYWDELEKSIVASVAKDVIVGIQKNQIEMAIIMETN